MALSYKVYGNSMAQRKPKVYFCHHPDDFYLLDDVADDIVAEADCTVFYRTDPIMDMEEHLSDLEQMNLFVIPITSSFLSKPSDAYSVEFAFAMEKHIPILPLMQEANLDQLFNEKCGDLQYLYKSSGDITAISYAEKLRNFLNAVLVGDKLANEIKSAFDAYIFLSYRKKDRVFAKELMRLIHQNDFCRDVAIWYDEFLTPGENFNTMIEDALKKSDIFALAVTPNLVNEQNYVMTTEYPMAVQSHKPVLPIELVPTDHNEMKKVYDGVGDIIDCNNHDALRDALSGFLKNIALREKDTDPEHNYLIALAYMSGIDVEKNPERAISILTESAEGGSSKALEKLISIYENGDGVECDLEKTVELQKKLLGIYRAAFNEMGDEEHARRYIRALLDLGNRCFALGEYEEAYNLYLELANASLELLENCSWDWLLCYLSTCYSRVGDLLLKTENYDDAIEVYESAISTAEKLFQADPSESSLRIVAAIYEDAIDFFSDFMIAIHKGEDISAEYAVKSLEVFEKLYENNPDNYFSELSAVYIKRGNLNCQKKDYSIAYEYFLKSLNLIEKHENKKRVHYFVNVAVCYISIGNVLLELKKTKDAKEYFNKAIERLLSASEKDSRQSIMLHLSDAYECLGTAYEYELDLETSRMYFKKSFDIYYPKMGEQTHEEKQELLSHLLEQAEEAKHGLSDIKLGQTVHFALALAYELMNSENIILDYHYYAEACYHLYMYHLLFTERDVSGLYGEKALQVWEILYQECPHIESFNKKAGMMRFLLKENSASE